LRLDRPGTLIDWAHRHLWQSLPRRWRRRGVELVGSALAPRPDPRPKRAVAPFYVAGALSTASGLGESARLCLKTLGAAGYDARGIDLSDAFRQDARITDANPHVGLAVPAAAMGPGTIILHVSGFTMAWAMLALGRGCVRGKTIIGYWAWELPDLPPSWRRGLAYAHEFWAPSRFTAAAIARATDRPVRIVPHPVSPAGDLVPDARRGDAKDPVIVLTAFDMRSGFARKNPLAAIAAFRAAFGDDPGFRLIVKVSQRQAYLPGWQALATASAGIGNIELEDRLTGAAEMSRLVGRADILLSLHRSEGFGLVLAEAMQRGKPVVATGWSGNMDFMTEENSCPVAYRLVPARDPQGSYDEADQSWADPDIAAASAALQRLADPEERWRLGWRAQQDARGLFAPERYRDAVAACFEPDLVAVSSSRGVAAVRVEG
jgi:glycosyltransferase involved in cell wall biosynthesis